VTASGTVTVLGGAGPDTITVNVTGSSDITLDGQGGDDHYVVYLGSMGDGDVHLADSGTTTGDRATVYGTPAADVLTVHNNVANGIDPQTGGYVQLAAGDRTVYYTASLELLTVDGGAGSDNFFVQPSQTTEITIVGGAPTFGDPGVPPGDTLQLDTFGQRFEILCGRIATEGGDPENFQLIRYFGIENLPLGSDDHPIGSDTKRFDFDWTPAATQPGSTSVAVNDLYQPGVNAYGWDAPLFGFDRGAASVTEAETPNLLRDGHWHSDARTFTAEVANGWYLVSVKTGDANFARDRLQVTDANKDTVLLERVDSASGQFAHPTFVVLVENGTVETEGIGTLALTFSNLGGDPYWVINGLDIWPGKLLGIGSSDPGSLAADGLTTQTLTGYGATPGIRWSPCRLGWMRPAAS
jgi:hypothetical protein